MTDPNSHTDPQLKEFIKFFDDLRKKDKAKYKLLISDVYNYCRFLLGEDFVAWSSPASQEFVDFQRYFDRAKSVMSEGNFDHMVESVRDTAFNRMTKKNWFQRLFS